MNLSHLTYFKKLAEVKHYTKAAAKLYIAQPTLSAAMSTLEKELGTCLFQKKNNKIELTESGRVFYTYVSQGLKSIETGIQAVREREGLINGTLNLGVLFAMQSRELSRALQSFQDECAEGFTINITQGFTADLIEELEEGKLDVVFVGHPVNAKGYDSFHCWAQELVVAVNKNHPLAQRDSVRLEELAGYRVLTYHDNNPVYEELQELFKESDVELDVEYSFNDEITLSSLVTSDTEGVALLCYSFLVKAFDEVKFISLEDAPAAFHKVYLVSRMDRSQPKVISSFVSYMKNHHFPTATVRSLKH